MTKKNNNQTRKTFASLSFGFYIFQYGDKRWCYKMAMNITDGKLKAFNIDDDNGDEDSKMLNRRVYKPKEKHKFVI